MAIFDLPDQAVVNGLAPYQGWWNGLVWGEGTEHIVEAALDGLLAYESRISDTPIPQGDGDILLGRWASGRTVTVPFRIFGGLAGHAARRREWVNAFSAADPYEQGWLVFRTLERAYMARARVTRRQVELSPEQGRTASSHAVVELKLADPKLYDGIDWVQDVLVPVGAVEGGGFDLAVEELPIDGAASSGGSVNAVNTGNAPAYPLIRVYNDIGAGSPITSVAVRNNTVAKEVEVVTAIAAGQFLTIDLDSLVRAVVGPHIHIDGSSRYGDWQHPREVWGLTPGNNTISSEVTGGDPTVRLDWLQPLL